MVRPTLDKARLAAELKYYVYVIFNQAASPIYVGMGSGDRCFQHFRRSHNKWLAAAIRKAGHDLPVVIIAEGLRRWEAWELEVALIAAIGRADRGLGTLFNHTDGGEGGDTSSGLKRSPETLAKMSEAGKKQIRTRESIEQGAAKNRGKKRSDAVRENLRQKNLGKVIGEEARQKMSEAARRRHAKTQTFCWTTPEGIVYRAPAPKHPEDVRGNLAFRGHTKSKEHRNKLSAASRGKHGGKWWTTPDGACYRAVTPRSAVDIPGRTFNSSTSVKGEVL